IHTQAYAPPRLFYRDLDHCNGSDLAAKGAAYVQDYLQKLQLKAQQQAKTVSNVTDAYLRGKGGDGLSGGTATWKLALYTAGGIGVAVLGALVVRKRRRA